MFPPPPLPSPARPESLEDYFQKRCTFGSKSGTKSLVPQAKFAKTVPEHLKVCHIWLIKLNINICLVIFFIHIIQLSLFSSEYSTFYLL